MSCKFPPSPFSWNYQGVTERWMLQKSSYTQPPEISWLGGGFKYFGNFHSCLGKISNLANIFQMGWNHQLDVYGKKNDVAQ